MGQPQSKNRRPKPGDHIYFGCNGHLYDHHGIYVGDDMVIHLAGAAKKLKPLPSCEKCGNKRFINGEIARTCIDCFLEGEPVEFYEYGVNFFEFEMRRSGTCSVHDSKPANEVIKTATDILEGNRDFGSYNLLFNNCETFAVYCKTGKALSLQVAGLLKATTVVAAAGLVGGPVASLAAVGVYNAAKVIYEAQRPR